MLKKWSVALGERSRYKEVFSNINLMLALIKSRGYLIPDVEPAAIDAICPAGKSSDLRPKEDLDAEEQIMLECKLEELLHRGQPADLVAANAIMKKIVGYNTNGNGHGYSSSEGRIDDELNLLAEKVGLMETMKEEGNTDAESYQEMRGECRAMIPKLFQLANSELSEAIMSNIIFKQHFILTFMIVKLLALNQRLHEIVDDVESSPVKTGDLHMDMLIDLDIAANNMEKSKKKDGCSSNLDIFELYKLDTPIKEPLRPGLNLYTGSNYAIVDVLTVDNAKYLRVFNASETDNLKGVKVEDVCVGCVESSQTRTVKLEAEFGLPIQLKLSYQLNGRQLSDQLSLTII